MSGQLIGIARAPVLRAPLEELASAEISVAAGLHGDARGRNRGRQITVLFREGWEEACRVVGTQLPWVTRRANLYVSALESVRTAGGFLHIGSVALEVIMETAPCSLMEQACTGLRTAMKPDWRGGVCCVVRQGGEIRVGDAVSYVRALG